MFFCLFVYLFFLYVLWGGGCAHACLCMCFVFVFSVKHKQAQVWESLNHKTKHISIAFGVSESAYQLRFLVTAWLTWPLSWKE